MILTASTKSRVILGLIKDIPGFMTKKDVKALTIDPKKSVLGFEDASEALTTIEMNDDDKKRVEHKEDSTKIADLFPNVRLAAELEIIRDTDRTKYKEFCDKLFELNTIAKEIDDAAGPSLDFLLDEIAQNADKSVIDDIKNMGVQIIDVEKGKVTK